MKKVKLLQACFHLLVSVLSKPAIALQIIVGSVVAKDDCVLSASAITENGIRNIVFQK